MLCKHFRRRGEKPMQPRSWLYNSFIPCRFKHSHLASRVTQGERLMARVHAHPRSMGPKMDSLLYAILGSLLRNRFISPLWIRQTDSLSSEGFGREMAAQEQKPVSGPDPDSPEGLQFSIVNSTLLWRKRCPSIMFLVSLLVSFTRARPMQKSGKHRTP